MLSVVGSVLLVTFVQRALFQLLSFHVEALTVIVLLDQTHRYWCAWGGTQMKKSMKIFEVVKQFAPKDSGVKTV
jgi:hypothetical protein